MKRFLIIAFLIGTAVYTADAQLLEDSDRRLKTKKTERKGFLFFRNKKKPNNSRRIPNAGRRTSPRYSSASSPFRLSRSTSPRYSSAQDRQKRYSTRPRSSGGVTSFKTRKTSPRYSRGNPFRRSQFKGSPRYSGGNPFRGKNHKVNIRYSQGSPFGGVDFKVRPRYTGTKIRFFGNFKEWGVSKSYRQSSIWKGDLKISHRRIGNQHRSSNYHTAMKFSNPKIRKMFRKWNIFWVRVNRNKQNPDGVNKPIKKPKFDKKERVIWNN